MTAEPELTAENAWEEMRRYRELVRAKDPATMEKRRLAAICPVCGKRLIDGAHR